MTSIQIVKVLGTPYYIYFITANQIFSYHKEFSKYKIKYNTTTQIQKFEKHSMKKWNITLLTDEICYVPLLYYIIHEALLFVACRLVYSSLPSLNRAVYRSGLLRTVPIPLFYFHWIHMFHLEQKKNTKKEFTMQCNFSFSRGQHWRSHQVNFENQVRGDESFSREQHWHTH